LCVCMYAYHSKGNSTTSSTFGEWFVNSSTANSHGSHRITLNNAQTLDNRVCMYVCMYVCMLYVCCMCVRMQYSAVSVTTLSRTLSCAISCHTIWLWFHIAPHHTIPYHIIPYHAIPYHAIPYHTIPCHTNTIPYHTMPYHSIHILRFLRLTPQPSILLKTFCWLMERENSIHTSRLRYIHTLRIRVVNPCSLRYVCMHVWSSVCCVW